MQLLPLQDLLSATTGGFKEPKRSLVGEPKAIKRVSKRKSRALFGGPKTIRNAVG